MLAHNVYFSLHDRSPEAIRHLLDACRTHLATRPGVSAFRTLNPACVNKLVVSGARSRRIAVHPPMMLTATITIAESPILVQDACPMVSLARPRRASDVRCGQTPLPQRFSPSARVRAGRCRRRS